MKVKDNTKHLESYKHYICKFCNADYFLTDELYHHFIKEHSEDRQKKPYCCEKCGCTFGRLWILNRHKKGKIIYNWIILKIKYFSKVCVIYNFNKRRSSFLNMYTTFLCTVVDPCYWLKRTFHLFIFKFIHSYWRSFLTNNKGQLHFHKFTYGIFSDIKYTTNLIKGFHCRTSLINFSKL